MQIVTLDFETYWDTQHSLRRMNPIAYVQHPKTELISASLKIGNGKTHVAFGEEKIRQLFGMVDWSRAAAVAHNMEAFDALVLSWRLGINPKMYLCTLAMARAIMAKTHSLSLASLVKTFKLGEKDATVLYETRGKNLKDFTYAELEAMKKYNAEDTDQCFGVFQKLLPNFSLDELWHLNSKIKSFAEPKIMIDEEVMRAALEREQQNKHDSLMELAAMFADRIVPNGDIGELAPEYIAERTRKILASAPMFSEILTSCGVPVPTKPSPSNPEKQIPALAKTDEAFQALVDHDDPIVAAAASARLQAKSTQTETRITAFLEASALTGGKWPVTVKYCGADTTGRSSGFLYNPLNLARINPRNPRPSDALRMGLIAPPGHVLVVVDSSGIEMRVNHSLWKVPYSTQLWAQDAEADLYRASYAIKLGITPEEVTADQRQASKVENLALGFGMGAAKYVDTARIMGGLEITLEQAQEDVWDWRGRHPEIAGRSGGWRLAERSLEAVFNGLERAVDPDGLCITTPEGLRLPSGRIIRYPALRREVGTMIDYATGEIRQTTGWVYGEGRYKTNIYGGKICENLAQALARDVVYGAALRVFNDSGLYPSLEVYDELVYVVPERDADATLELVHHHMRKHVDWFPVLTPWSEGAIVSRYGDA